MFNLGRRKSRKQIVFRLQEVAELAQGKNYVEITNTFYSLRDKLLNQNSFSPSWHAIDTEIVNILDEVKEKSYLQKGYRGTILVYAKWIDSFIEHRGNKTLRRFRVDISEKEKFTVEVLKTEKDDYDTEQLVSMNNLRKTKLLEIDRLASERRGLLKKQAEIQDSFKRINLNSEIEHCDSEYKMLYRQVMQLNDAIAILGGKIRIRKDNIFIEELSCAIPLPEDFRDYGTTNAITASELSKNTQKGKNILKHIEQENENILQQYGIDVTVTSETVVKNHMDFSVPESMNTGNSVIEEP